MNKGCGKERPVRKTLCQLFEGHKGSCQAVIYWENESPSCSNHSPHGNVSQDTEPDEVPALLTGSDSGSPFILSDKIDHNSRLGTWHDVLYARDVKTFIRLLKEDYPCVKKIDKCHLNQNKGWICVNCRFRFKIDKLSGNLE